MSASKDKRTRKDLREQGIDIRSAKEKLAEKKKKRNKLVAGISGAVALLFAIFVLIVNSGFFYRNVTAAEIEGTKFSIVDYNYFYYTTYLNYMNTGYGYIYIDTSTPLSSQTYNAGDEQDEDYTWADYFADKTKESMKTQTMLLTEAEAAGVTELNEEYQDIFDDQIEAMEANVDASEKYNTVKAYLAAYYGKGMTYEIWKEHLTSALLASQYSEQVSDEFKDSYTDDDLETYYVEKQDEFDRFTYKSYLVPGTESEDGGIDAETGMAEAKDIADAIVDGTDSEEAFNNLVYEYGGAAYEEADSTLSSDVTGKTLTASYSDYSQWLLNSSRKEGDVTAIEAEGGYYVVYFINRDGNGEIDLMDARVILIKPEEVEADDDATTEETAALETEAMEAAKTLADEIYAEWRDGDADEDSFAALAEEHSDDTISNTDGGLYENIYPGRMSDELEQWLFDSSRAAGDTDIIETDSGYYIVYYKDKTGQTYRQFLAEQGKLEEDYDDWKTTELENYSMTKKFFFRFTTG